MENQNQNEFNQGVSNRDEFLQEREFLKERLELAANRIKEVQKEEGVMEYQPLFSKLAVFLTEALAHGKRIREEGYYDKSTEELSEDYRSLVADLFAGEYETSFANPSYTCSRFGETVGQYLAFFVYEEKQILPFIYEDRTEEVVIRLELFLELYGLFTDAFHDTGKAPEASSVKDVLYWYVSDYSEDAAVARIREQFLPEEGLAYRIIMTSDLCKPNYLYRYGEYVSENERKTAEYIASLPEETIALMADTFTEGFRKGFEAAGKDLTIKKTVNIRYNLGFERVVKKAILNYDRMGLKPLLFRAYGDIFRKRGLVKTGYRGGCINRQAEYDHREDLSLFLDGHLVTRKLECLKEAYEQYKTEVRDYAGPACMETFGETEFTPVEKKENPAFDETGRKLSVEYQSKAGEMANAYIHREERSFTIIAFPVPEIGSDFEEIFKETVRINTLDYALYQRIQGTIIDTLNLADSARIVGRDGNETELVVNLCKLKDPEKEAIFENCVADVNIPVGEVFTSPVLEGTNGLLHVKKVYINGLAYENLRIRVEEGITKEYSCTNLANNVIEENILYHHEFLPMGEFAIGTNTTAYSVARRLGIADRFPILIAEKMGPHFAFGDTCYSEEEEVRVYNPDGKEIVAKENTYSLKRRENPLEAYFHCHTDITIPYEEIGLIEAVRKDGSRVAVIRDGRFVLPGTEELNKALEE